MDSRVIKPKVLPKPLLLKDYLLDELSSCSSSGFESFPRRQCCATKVRFLIEIDLKNKHLLRKNKHLNLNKTSPLSLLQRPSKSALAAFQTLITAVKRFPFGAVSGSSLRRTLSKKILEKSSIWKRKSNQKGIEQWKSFRQLLQEDSEPSNISNSSTTTTEFTASGEFSGSNFSSEVELNLPCEKSEVAEVLNDGGEIPNDDVSTNSTTISANANSLTGTKAKQLFSPVSVLDCPFEDDDDEDKEEEVSSAFHTKGGRKKPPERILKPECQLELVNLVERFVYVPHLDNDFLVPQPFVKLILGVEQEGEDEKSRVEQKALDLLQHMKDTIPSYGIRVKADALLLDFFREQIIVQKWGGYAFDENVLEEAESWLIGRKSRELFLEWHVQSNREVYIKGIEKGGEWKSLDPENKEVASELEVQVFATLLDELLVDYLI